MANSFMQKCKRMRERMASRLVNKLILLFSAIIILIVGSLTVISYQMQHQEAVRQIISSTSNNLRLVNQNLEDYVKEMEKRSLPQTKFDELSYALVHEGEDYASRILLEDYLKGIFYNQQDLDSIFLYLVGSGKYYEVKRRNNDVTITVREDNSVLQQPWYEEAIMSRYNRSYQSLLFSGYSDSYSERTSTGHFAYHRVLRSIAARVPRAAISFYYNDSVFADILADVPMKERERLFWLSPEGELFISSDLEGASMWAGKISQADLPTEGQGEFLLGRGGERELMIYNVGSKEGWRLIKSIPYSQINAAARQTLRFSLLIGIGFLMLAVLLVIVLSNQITKPLKALSIQMKRFGAGDFSATLEVVGNDELAYISHRFNSMVSRTHALINERYKLKLAEKNAVLKALEAEINPHFLYNALQAISTKALKSNQQDIVEMVDALALSLRYCISGKDIVTAREELRHIAHYLGLQKARFGERLIVAYDWDESLRDIEIPKLSLQTLVENAIKHGVEKVSTPVHICIRARSGVKGMAMTVTNDGEIPEPRLVEIRDRLAQKWEDALGRQENIGLVNLHARLKLLYGEAATLALYSADGRTEMTIYLQPEALTRRGEKA